MVPDGDETLTAAAEVAVRVKRVTFVVAIVALVGVHPVPMPSARELIPPKGTFDQYSSVPSET